jgi:uncharacterized protein (DUF433 family)
MASRPGQHRALRAKGRDHPYVERRPGVCGGEPVIRGTRFPVRSLVTYIYRVGMTPEEMVEAWPFLTLASIHDALSFYHDHRKVIDRAISENTETVVKRRSGDLGVEPEVRRRGARDRR